MERTLPLKPQYQAAWLGHFCRVIFDGLPRFDGSQYFLYGNFPLKHTLNGVDTEKGFGNVHCKIILAHERVTGTCKGERTGRLRDKGQPCKASDSAELFQFVVLPVSIIISNNPAQNHCNSCYHNSSTGIS
jgi:hypothetical protein